LFFLHRRHVRDERSRNRDSDSVRDGYADAFSFPESFAFSFSVAFPESFSFADSESFALKV
jgi:hypothetical protein